LTIFENDWNYNCKITTESGKEYLIYANKLHNDRYDYWQGWHCEVGASRLYITPDFDVYGGTCKNDMLGNALTDFTLLEYTVCKQERCNGCNDDLIVTKYDPTKV